MRETKYTKKLYNAIRKLNLDKEELKQLLLCLYINGCPSEDCAKLFGTTEDKIIKFLKSEELYEYQACSKCGQLRDRLKGFHQHNKRLTCKICEKEREKEYNKNNKEHQRERHKLYNKNNKEKRKRSRQEYNKNNRDKIKESRQIYNKNNKEKIKEYDKDHYENNKGKILEHSKEYYQNNRKERKKYKKEYNQRNASIEQVQKLDMFEEVSGNQIRCKYCGRWMIPTISQVYNRLQGVHINDNHYIYCSEKCKEECPTYNKILYPKGFKQASSREVNPVLRQLVLKRDNYICQKCGKSQDELTVGLHCHHVTPAVNSPIEANDPDNCITLCKDCHKEVHKIPGCKYNELKCA